MPSFIVLSMSSRVATPCVAKIKCHFEFKSRELEVWTYLLEPNDSLNMPRTKTSVLIERVSIQIQANNSVQPSKLPVPEELTSLM